MTLQNTPEDEIQTFTIDSHNIVENRFNRFDDELIDRYFNEDGKAAIEKYVQRKVTEARIDELEIISHVSFDSTEDDDSDVLFDQIADDYIQGRITELSQTLKERE